MRLEPGFKQTAVGVIPADWNVSTVGDEFSIQLGKMLDSEKNVGVPKPFLGNRSVQWGRTDISDIGLVKLTPSDLQRFRLRGGDLLVCEGGEVGRAAIWQEPLEECYYQKALHRLRPTGGYNVTLMLYVLRRLASTGFLLNFVTQTSIAHLPKDKFKTVPIPVPPTSIEQEAIAEALSDADALIDSIEQLLTKKRQIKQGALQELLSGTRRLSGFERGIGPKQTGVGLIPQDWEVRPLASLISSLEAGVSVNSAAKTSEAYSHGAAILKTSCVIRGRFLPDESKSILPRDLSRARVNPLRDTILISRMNTPALVGECGYVERDYPNLFLPDRLWMTRHDSHLPLCVRWLAYLLSSSAFNRALKNSATGTSGSMKNIAQDALLAVLVPFPPTMAEQEAIATTLCDMDTEMAAVETKLAKARQIKQGMVQELLTGRVRLA